MSDGVDLPVHMWPFRGRFGRYGASRILQLAVDHRHQGRRYGEQLVTFGLMHAIWVSRFQATRFVLVDAVPDLVEWYGGLGFKILKTEQRQRRKKAQGRGQDPNAIAVRMLYDLNDIARDEDFLRRIDQVFRS